jgi:hypothetical protein
MLPMMTLYPWVIGKTLTLGLTVAAPTQPESEADWWQTGNRGVPR